jgi:preprotein translocase subunit SecE
MAVQDQFERLREMGPRTTTFLGEVSTEMRKVHWPTRQETYAATGVVLVVSIIVAIFLGVVDFSVSHIVRSILG